MILKKKSASMNFAAFHNLTWHLQSSCYCRQLKQNAEEVDDQEQNDES